MSESEFFVKINKIWSWCIFGVVFTITVTIGAAHISHVNADARKSEVEYQYSVDRSKYMMLERQFEAARKENK